MMLHRFSGLTVMHTHIAKLNNIQYWLYNNKLSYMTLSKMGADIQYYNNGHTVSHSLSQYKHCLWRN